MGIWARRQRKEFEEGERQRQREAERESMYASTSNIYFQ